MPARLPRFAFSRAAFPAWAILGVGLLLTALAGFGVKRSIDANAQAEFTSICDVIVQKIRERLAVYDATLREGIHLFARSKAVSRSEWRVFYEKMAANRLLAGVRAFGVVKVIRPKELNSHISAVRAEGFPDYTVRPEGSREIYAPIVYTEPFRDRILRALGMDVFAEPTRRAALERARDSGRAAITGKVVLFSETDTDIQPGFVMYAPIFRTRAPLATTEQRRSALIGWVYSSYGMQDMMEDILQDLQKQAPNRVAVFIYDRGQPVAANVLYRSGSLTAPGPNSLFYVERKMDFNGHPWLAVFDRDPWSADVSYTAAWLSAVAGAVISVLLFVLALSYRFSRSDPPGTSKR
jgi:CHASE1-domain containing sensor protein